MAEDKEPYGNVDYADPGHKADGKKRYPIDTPEHIRAAWSYINQEKNHEGYTAEQVASIKAKIVAAWKRKIDSAGPPSAEKKNLSYSEIALLKGLEGIDESGLVLLKRDGCLRDGIFKAKHAQSYEDLSPNAEEMDIINSAALFPQQSTKYFMIRGANPLGVSSESDIEGDSFSKKAEKTMAAQGAYLPLLQDHNHDLINALPVGFSTKSYMTSKGLREDYAIPIEPYNADIRAALLNGSVTRMSVGVLVKPQDRLCSSCKTKSIYSYSCSHKPGQVDENGEVTSVIINDVLRYIERSLCNVPVRTGTSMKALDPAHKLDSNQEVALEEKNQKLGFPPFCFTGEEFDVLNYLIGNSSAYKDLPLLQARTDQVKSTQSSVDPDKVEAFISNKNFDGGLILSRDESLYMIDGHHRLEAAKAAGRPSVWAHTLSLPDYPVGARIFAEQLGMNPQVLIDNMSSKSLVVDIEVDLAASVFNDPLFEKGGLYGEIVPVVNQNLTAATISTVNTIEDSIVAEKSVKETEQVTEEVAKAVATEATKAEDEAEKAKKSDEDDECMKGINASGTVDEDGTEKAKKPADDEDDECMKGKDKGAGGKDQDGDNDTHDGVKSKSMKVEAFISEDSNLVIKSLIASNKEQSLQLSKALDAFKAQEAQVTKQLEVMAEQSKTIDKLCDLQKELGETVMAAANFSTQELLEKVTRLMGANEVAKVQNKAAEPGDQLLDIFALRKAK